MPKNNLLTIGLDAKKSKTLISQQLTDLTKKLSTSKSLKAVAGLDVAGSRKNIQAQLKEISKNLSLDVKFNIKLNDVTKQAKQAADSVKKTVNDSLKADTLATNIKSQQQALLNLHKYYNGFANDPALANKWEKLFDTSSIITSQQELTNLRAHVLHFKREVDTSSNVINNAVTTATANLIAMRVAMELLNVVVNAFAAGIRNIENLDATLVELNRVADVTPIQLEAITDKAYELADAVGKTGIDVLQATQQFKQAGYTLEESMDSMARAALVGTIVSEDVKDAAQISSTIISILKGTKRDASEAMNVINILNEVSNNSAVGFDALSTGLEHAAGTLHQTNTSLEETTGLLTGAYTTLRNMSTSSASLITISQRLRGVSEDGEDSAQFIAKLDKAFTDLRDSSGNIVGSIRIMDNGELRSTYDILKDMSEILPKVSSAERQYVSELAAGKPRVAALNAILDNWREVEAATQQALSSYKSAEKEAEVWRNSIEGIKTEIASLQQELSKNTIDDGAIKGVLIVFRELLNVLVTITSNKAVMSFLTTGLATFLGVKTIQNGSKIISTLKQVGSATKGLAQRYLALGASANVAAAGQSAVDASSESAATSVTAAGNAAKKSATGFTILGKAINANLVFAAVSVAVAGLTTLFQHLSQAQEEAKQAALDAAAAYEESASTLNSTIGNLESLEDEFTRLSRGVDENGKNVSLAATEYDRYKQIVSEIIGISPKLIKGYNDEGDAIVNNNTLIQEAIGLQKELNEQKRQEYLNSGEGILGDTLDQIKTAKDEIAQLTQPTGLNFDKNIFQLMSADSDNWWDSAEEKVSGILSDMGILVKYTDDYGNELEKLDYSKLIVQQDMLIARLQEEHNLSEESAQTLRNRIGLIDNEISKVNAATVQVQNYLKVWASDQTRNGEWYPEIPVEYLDEFNNALADISNNTTLTLAEMQVAVKNLGTSFIAMKTDLPTTEIDELKTKLADGTITQEEFDDALEVHLAAIEALKQQYPELAVLLGYIIENYRGLSDVVSENPLTGAIDVDSMTAQLEAFNEQIGNLYSSYDVLNQALDDFAEMGAISADTFKAITDNNLWEYVQISADGVHILTGELLNNEAALRENAKMQLQLGLAGELAKIAQDGLSDAEAAAGSAAAGASGNIGQAAEVIRIIGEKSTVSASQVNELNVALGGIGLNWSTQKAQINTVVTSYQNAVKSIDAITYSSNSASNAFGGYSGAARGAGNASSAAAKQVDELTESLKAQKEALEATKDALEDKKKKYESALRAIKKVLDDEIDALKLANDAIKETDGFDGLKEQIKDLEDEITSISNAINYIIGKNLDSLNDSLDDINDALEKSEEAYQLALDNLEEFYTKETKLIKEATDALTEHLDKLNEQSNALPNVIDHSLSKELETLREELERLDDIGVPDSYAARIQAIQNEIDAINAKTEAENKALALQKAQDAYDKARTQRTARVYSHDKGFSWMTNQADIDSAKESLDTAIRDKQIYDLQQQQNSLKDTLQAEKDAINEQIDALQDYKDSYADFVKEIQMQTDYAIMVEAFGNDWLSNLLNNRELFYTDFTTKYLDLQNQINDNTKRQESYKEQQDLLDQQYESDKEFLKNEKTDREADLIDKQEYYQNLIDELTNYKQEFTDFVDEIKIQKDLEIANEQLGADWQEKILTDRKGLFEDFKTHYLDTQKKINDLTDEKTANEERILELEKLKIAWQATVDAYDDQQDRLNAKQILGKKWEKDVLDGRIKNIKNFKKEYTKIQKELVKLADEIVAKNKEIAESEAAFKSANSGSGGGSGSSGGTGGRNTGATVVQPRYKATDKTGKDLTANVFDSEQAAVDWLKTNLPSNYYAGNWKVQAFAKGTPSAPEEMLAFLHELGDELIIPASANHGVLRKLQKGDGVIPANLTENLMQIAAAWNPAKQVLEDSQRNLMNSIGAVTNTSIANQIFNYHVANQNINEVNDGAGFARVIKEQLPNDLLRELNRR